MNDKYNNEEIINLLVKIDKIGLHTVYDGSNDDAAIVVVVLKDKTVYEIWSNDDNPTLNIEEINSRK